MRFCRRAHGTPQNLAILASAFHPPTRAHLALAHEAIAAGADEVLFVVPGVLPHKQYDSVTLEQRLELVLAATCAEPRFSTAVTEGGLFLEIARECREHYPAAGLAFLCGRDAAERIVGWDYGSGPSIEEQLREFHLWVAPREGAYSPPPELRQGIRQLQLTGDYDEVSATEVRRRIQVEQPWRHLVPEAIAERVRALYALCLVLVLAATVSAAQTHCQVSGTVRDDRGAPVRFAAVTAVPAAALEMTPAGGASASERGEFCLTGLPPGQYRLHATARLRPPSASAGCPDAECCAPAFELAPAAAPDRVFVGASAPEARSELRMRRVPAYCLRGEIRSRSGQLVDEPAVRLEFPGGGGAAVVRTEGGRFLITGLLPGLYFLAVHSHERLLVRQAVRIAPRPTPLYEVVNLP